MSTSNQKVLIIQEASRELSTISMRHVLREVKLKRGDKIKILGIIKAFRTSSRQYPGLCGLVPKDKTKLHSSATINKHKEDITEEIQKKLDQYSNCAEFGEILKIAETLQVECGIEVMAGLLKEVAVEYAKSFQATHVILHRKFKKELKYFTKNLSCGVYRMKLDTVEMIRPPQAKEVSLLPPGIGQETTSNHETNQWRNAIKNSTCSLCMNKRPLIELKKRFTYAELQLATNGFCHENLLSDHGRKIYLGLINDQRKILIRELPSATIKYEEFKIEVQILEEIRHENVAMLLGSCTEGPHRLLVYEYICNGSLNKQLSEQSKNLTWEKRINIAYGAAKGLECLHRVRIYGSMRPSNILITHDYQPLLAYYGLTVNQYEALGQSSNTTVLKTFEYLAPEYEETGIDLSKADVFSFGVVLLELITGRKTIEDTEGQTFLRWARPLLRQKKYMELIDPMLQDSVDLYQLYWMTRVADKCLSWDPKSRYSIKKVVTTLFGVINRSDVEDFSPTESELLTATTR